jgi:hypothetical protein
MIEAWITYSAGEVSFEFIYGYIPLCPETFPKGE